MKASGHRTARLAVVLLCLNAVLVAEPAAAAQQPKGTRLIAGDSWLLGPGVVSKGGVDVCANGAGSSPDCDNVVAVGQKWECVELTQRLYQAKGWHTGAWSAGGEILWSAYEIYDWAEYNGLEQKGDGSNYTPVPGDMIVHKAAPGMAAGHVAIVDSVGKDTVSVVEQNVEGSNGWAIYQRDAAGVLSRPGIAAPIAGIVHSPNNPNKNEAAKSEVPRVPAGASFFGDFNRDGRADVAMLTDGTASAGVSGASVMVALSTGSGFAQPTRWLNLVDWGWSGMKPLVGDFNGDGWPDFASLNKINDNAEVMVALNTRQGSFAAPQRWVALDKWGWAGMKPLVGDFNGDGRADFASLNDGISGQPTGSEVMVGLSHGSGFYKPSRWRSLETWNWANMKPMAADFNRDGKADFASLNVGYNGGEGSEVQVFLSNGYRFDTFSRWLGLSKWGWSGMKPLVGDFDGDGWMDFASLNDRGGSAEVMVARGNGYRFSATPTRWLWLDKWGWSGMKPFTGDFNGDRRVDFASLNDGSGSSHLMVGISAGSGFGQPARWRSLETWNWARITLPV